MLRMSRLKKVLVGSAFAGAFLFAAPAAGADELPAPVIDSAGFLNGVRADLAKLGVATAPVDQAVTEGIDQALGAAAHRVAQATGIIAEPITPAQPAAPANSVTPANSPTPAAAQADYQSAPGQQGHPGQPLTNPEPLGLAQLERATQPDFKPQVADPNYVFKNDLFSKIAAGKPMADFVLHRVPGSYFDAPRIPEESNQALGRGNSLYGPGTPIYVGQNSMCTLTAAGYDNAGNKVGLTAGHCAEPGEQVLSADSWQVGPTGTVVDKNAYLDYAVIQFNDKAEISNSYNGVTAHAVGGTARPGDVACKHGVATGTTCGMVYTQGSEKQFNQVCAMMGDSGAPLMKNGAVIGAISGGVGPISCRTPWQGALHVPSTATTMDSIVADLNRRGGVGAGFRLQP
ncbi:S1 family peptidase [Corynebacterium lizhenjunii]|uniref:S1 family peptidase n=1 Tax=Corynebacterium lizhenjunii TaxID=2709394 RepID=UPI0013EB198D|nr:S1 family peptidase [Corynebacterium lizhenjunii]